MRYLLRCVGGSVELPSTTRSRHQPFHSRATPPLMAGVYLKLLDWSTVGADILAGCVLPVEKGARYCRKYSILSCGANRTAQFLRNLTHRGPHPEHDYSLLPTSQFVPIPNTRCSVPSVSLRNLERASPRGVAVRHGRSEPAQMPRGARPFKLGGLYRPAGTVVDH